MRNGSTISVIIPALDEEQSIGKVLPAIPDWVDDVYVVDNGSSDETVEIAMSLGAHIVKEDLRGYGAACLAGIAALKDPDVVVFLDADFSDFPEEMHKIVDPIVRMEADLVIGSRLLGRRESGALPLQARFGNWLACTLIRLIWRTGYTDLGPFRAIRYSSLRELDMRDRDYGWTVEMQIKAAHHQLSIKEVAVSYRKRLGKSKITGTVKGTVCAGTKILWTIFLALITNRNRSD